MRFAALTTSYNAWDRSTPHLRIRVLNVSPVVPHALRIVTAFITALLFFHLHATTPLAEEKSLAVDAYARVLKTYVNQAGLVDYAGLKANRGDLDAFARALGALPAETTRSWTEKQWIAFWINAYNALTLKAIIDHYPIKASLLRSVAYPKNSIRQIPGVWDELRFVVIGDPLTLDGIEHQILRARYNEPRIHLALVCAALGCPKLRNEPYEAERLDGQFDEQARSFLADPKKFRLDRPGRGVHLSPIFKWFGSDFVKTYGTDSSFRGFSDAKRAVLNFVSEYVGESDRDFLRGGGYILDSLPYDWTLNEPAR
jgi:hypothetical protein